MAKVAVDNQYFFIFDGKTHGYVHGQKRFSTSRIERGDYNHIRGLVFANHELQIGTQDTKSLIHDVTVSFFNHNGMCLM